MHIEYFITGHGYGHALRSAIIVSELPLSVEVTLRSSVPQVFFHENIRRPFRYEASEFDCGCLQSDGVSVDIQATLEAYNRIATENQLSIDTEVDRCRNQNIDMIVSDITPFAFEIARKSGIPSIAISNFTWYDIYYTYISRFPAFTDCLETMLAQYRSATLLLSLYPSLPMTYFHSQKPVPLIGRKGRNCRDRLNKVFKLDPQKELALIYTGNFGHSSLKWDELEFFKLWEFIGLYPLPGSPDNFHLIDTNTISYPDCIASADCVISKLGYGVVAECMLNGTPVIYLPRNDFAEYPVLEKAVRAWGGGLRISSEQFHGLDWKSALDKVKTLKARLPPVTSGTRMCADHLLDQLKE